MKPYWQSADGAITVFHARCEDVIAAGLVGACDLIHADPPYGVNERTERKANGRGGQFDKAKAPVRRHDFEPVEGDDKPYDPAFLLALDRPTVLWGANHYSDRVPGSPSWIIWDKREAMTPDDNADGEMAWSNLGGPARIFRHWWRGALRKTEKEDKHLGPTQKPKALSAYVFQRAKLKKGALLFVPYLGTGPDLPVAQAMGLRVIACEVKRKIIDGALSARLGAITPEKAAEPCGPLFRLKEKP